MTSNNAMVLWVLGGAGTLFLYAAYKARSPLDVLRNHLDGGSNSTSAGSYNAAPAPGVTNKPAPVSYLAPGPATGGPTIQSGTYVPPVRGGLVTV